jgi:ABC-2 type transport system ATP-binding protein
MLDADLAVCVRGLAKHYRNPWTLRVARGLEGLDLDVRRGEVLGILGPNGAGKTTTLKLLAGLLKPSRGNAWLLGVPIDDPRSRGPLGFLPEQPYFYDYLTGLEYLQLAAGLSGLPRDRAAANARHWMDRVGLGERTGLKLRKYSKGMLQRLGLAAALVHEPEILILDEPMSGLDPYGRRDVRELILEQHARGVTVLFSSHVLPDVESVADRVVILHRGRLVREAESGDLRDGSGRVLVRCEGAPLLEIPPGWNGRVTRRPGGASSEFEVRGLEINPVLDWLLRCGAKVQSVTPLGSALEELFLSATAEDADASDGAPAAGDASVHPRRGRSVA